MVQEGGADDADDDERHGREDYRKILDRLFHDDQNRSQWKLAKARNARKPKEGSKRA